MTNTRVCPFVSYLMGSEDFSADNAVLWTSSSSHHNRFECHSNTVVIGKNIPSTGSTVRHNIPQFLQPGQTSRLCLNSSRTLEESCCSDLKLAELHTDMAMVSLKACG